MPTIDFRHLTPAERLELIGDLWESLDDDDVPVPVEVRNELDRRNATFRENKANAVPWTDVRAKLRQPRV